MFFLQTENTFMYDHGISLFASIVTLLAFLVTFGNILHSIRKKSEEEKARNKKTLYMIDLILENEKEKIKNHFEWIKKIRERSFLHKFPLPVREGHYNLDEIHDGIPEIEENTPKTNAYSVGMQHIDLPTLGKTNIRTKNEDIFVIGETYRYIHDHKVVKSIRNYKRNLKINIKNQHLNLDSESLEKITNRINNLNEIITLIDSLDIENIVFIAGYDREVEFIINQELDEEDLESIKEEINKLIKLRNQLEKILKDLNTD